MHHRSILIAILLCVVLHDTSLLIVRVYASITDTYINHDGIRRICLCNINYHFFLSLTSVADTAVAS